MYTERELLVPTELTFFYYTFYFCSMCRYFLGKYIVVREDQTLFMS
jgi:hypothetical protein